MPLNFLKRMRKPERTHRALARSWRISIGQAKTSLLSPAGRNPQIVDGLPRRKQFAHPPRLLTATGPCLEGSLGILELRLDLRVWPAFGSCALGSPKPTMEFVKLLFKFLLFAIHLCRQDRGDRPVKGPKFICCHGLKIDIFHRLPPGRDSQMIFVD
jgi:hypothetical protein